MQGNFYFKETGNSAELLTLTDKGPGDGGLKYLRMLCIWSYFGPHALIEDPNRTKLVIFNNVNFICVKNSLLNKKNIEVKMSLMMVSCTFSWIIPYLFHSNEKII